MPKADTDPIATAEGHDIARFTWELGPEGGEAMVVGFDVAVLTPDGRVAKVYGFLDKVPAGV
ncbi:hypothetical protein [Actinomadura vinacea]